jgi:hypothetical protein
MQSKRVFDQAKPRGSFIRFAQQLNRIAESIPFMTRIMGFFDKRNFVGIRDDSLLRTRLREILTSKSAKNESANELDMLL